MGNLAFYKFTCMPFGLCNVPVTFEHLMQNTLGALNLIYYIIYLDDMIVFGHTEEERLECLCIVFEWFCEFNLKLKPSKVQHVSCKGICPSKENMHAVEEFPMPENFTQVHTFCRLAGHYRCFIKGFAHIARPLHAVLGRGKNGPSAVATQGMGSGENFER